MTDSHYTYGDAGASRLAWEATASCAPDYSGIP